MRDGSVIRSTGRRLWERVRRRLGPPSPVEAEIVASGIVDPEWYLDLNPDVRRAGMDPVLHFARHGFREGRQPNPLFTGRWYDDPRPRLEESGRDGASSNADIAGEIARSGILDREWYLQAYPEPVAAVIDPHRHFAERIEENRWPNALFSPSWYLAKHPEVAGSGLAPVIHYIRHGSHIGLDPHPLFDSRLYLSSHRRVRREDALRHFLETRRHAYVAPMRLPAPSSAIHRRYRAEYEPRRS